MQDQESKDRAEDGFHAEQKGGDRRRCMSLTHDLKGIRNTAGQDAGIQDGYGSGQDPFQGWLFKQKHGNGAVTGAHHELDHGKFDRIRVRRKMADEQNVSGPKDRADQHDQVAGHNGQGLGERQKIKTNGRKSDTDPSLVSRSLFQEDSKERNDDDIKGCDETGFSCSGIHQTDLLKRSSEEQDAPTDKTGSNQIFSL